MNFQGTKAATIILCALLCFAMSNPPAIIRGRITANPSVAKRTGPEKMPLFLKSHEVVIGHGITGVAGNFVLSFENSGDSVFDLFCITPGPDSIYLHSFSSANFGEETQLLFPCEPDTTSAGDIICPKCKKEDQVYPIVYGEPIVITRQFDTAGRLSYKRTEDQEPRADTLAQVARYY